MTCTNKPDSNAVWFDEYVPSMLRGMDAFPTLCHFDTQGRGRAVLRHAPQVFVMTTVGCVLVEARSPRLADTIALRFYVVRPV